MYTEIQLTLVNESQDNKKSSVVVFQKNVATNYDEIAVAWRVIKNCGTGWRHKFSYPMQFQVGASDCWGNELIKPVDAFNGQLWSLSNNGSGDSIDLVNQVVPVGPKEVQVRNDWAQGSVNARIYKNGKLLALKTGVSPKEKAVFEFRPTIWIGVCAEVEEGEIINSAILQDINQELDLTGLASAEVVMSGGGVGIMAQPFTFELRNKVPA